MIRAYIAQGQSLQKIQEQIDIVDKVVDTIADDIDTLKVDLDKFKESINQLVLETVAGLNVEETTRIVADDYIQSQIKTIDLRIRSLEPSSKTN